GGGPGTAQAPAKAARKAIKDVGSRELIVLVPLVALIIGLGVYPKPVLDTVTPSVQPTVSVGEGEGTSDGPRARRSRHCVGRAEYRCRGRAAAADHLHRRRGWRAVGGRAAASTALACPGRAEPGVGRGRGRGVGLLRHR